MGSTTLLEILSLTDNKSRKKCFTYGSFKLKEEIWLLEELNGRYFTISVAYNDDQWIHRLPVRISGLLIYLEGLKTKPQRRKDTILSKTNVDFVPCTI